MYQQQQQAPFTPPMQQQQPYPQPIIKQNNPQTVLQVQNHAGGQIHEQPGPHAWTHVEPETQPVPLPKPLPPTSFSASLFGCFGDSSICCFGCCLPCLLYGDNHARIHGQGFWGACLLYLFCPVLTCIFASDTRRAIRTKYNLHEEPCSDCWVHCGCSWCAICQESRELKARCGVVTSKP